MSTQNENFWKHFQTMIKCHAQTEGIVQEAIIVKRGDIQNAPLELTRKTDLVSISVHSIHY